MKYLGENEQSIYYEDYFEGHPVRFAVDKKTRDVFISFDDMALIGGYKNAGEMIAANKDLMIEFLDGLKDGGMYQG